MPIMTRREAARRLWALARELDRKRILAFPGPCVLDPLTQDEMLMLATALELGAETLEPLGSVEEDDAFSEEAEDMPDWLRRKARRGGRR